MYNNKNNTTLSIEKTTHCRVYDPQWNTPTASLRMENCAGALQRFWSTQVAPTAGHEFEFIAHDVQPVYKPVQQIAVTPRKYAWGDCVLAITMIEFYDEDVLPERERGEGGLEANDVAKFAKIWWNLHDVVFGCKGPGWART
ncbi:MAG: hypothetical protein Q9186_007478, partial [Xanthomendoza sp. 1 TL-2023]